MKKPANYQNHKNRFICYECGITFQIFGILQDKRKNKPFCPNCGEYWEVRNGKTVVQQREEERENPGPRLPWSNEENQMIDDCISGKLTPKQIVNLTGRSIDSVYGKKARRIDELKKRGTVERYG